jgi:hypothetical protein
MFAAYVIVTIVTIASAFSGIAAILHFKPVLPGMARAGVPASWLTFPIDPMSCGDYDSAIVHRCRSGLDPPPAEPDQLRPVKRAGWQQGAVSRRACAWAEVSRHRRLWRSQSRHRRCTR